MTPALGARTRLTAESSMLLSMKHLILMTATALLALPAAATPPETTLPGADGPTIQPDRSITFKLKAPDAHTAQVAGGDGLGAGPFNMTKGIDGIWTVT